MFIRTRSPKTTGFTARMARRFHRSHDGVERSQCDDTDAVAVSKLSSCHARRRVHAPTVEEEAFAVDWRRSRRVRHRLVLRRSRRLFLGVLLSPSLMPNSASPTNTATRASSTAPVGQRSHHEAGRVCRGQRAAPTSGWTVSRDKSMTWFRPSDVSASMDMSLVVLVIQNTVSRSFTVPRCRRRGRSCGRLGLAVQAAVQHADAAVERAAASELPFGLKNSLSSGGPPD